MFTIWYQSEKPYLQINDTNSISLIMYLSAMGAENGKGYKQYLEQFFDANYDTLSNEDDITDVKNIKPAEMSFKFTDTEQKEYEFTVVKKGQIELIAREQRFENNRDNSPSSSSTTPETIDGATNSESIVAEIDSVLSDIEISVEESEDNQEKTRLKKIGDIISFVVNTVNSKGIVDVIELDSSKISDTSKFSDEIIYATSIDSLSDMVIKKYEGNLSQFNTQDNNSYFVIDNMNEIQLQTSSNQKSDTPAQEENNNVPNISNAEGEVKYYQAIDDDFNKYKSYETDSTNKKSFFEMWKQGNNYYAKVNPNNNYHKSLIQSHDTLLKPFFEYTRNPSATKIKNIKPAVYDVNSRSLTQKGEIELS